jgi:hypothetical protein
VRPRGWAGLRRRPGLGRLGCAPGAAAALGWAAQFGLLRPAAAAGLAALTS